MGLGAAGGPLLDALMLGGLYWHILKSPSNNAPSALVAGLCGSLLPPLPLFFTKCLAELGRQPCDRVVWGSSNGWFESDHPYELPPYCFSHAPPPFCFCSACWFASRAPYLLARRSLARRGRRSRISHGGCAVDEVLNNLAYRMFSLVKARFDHWLHVLQGGPAGWRLVNGGGRRDRLYVICPDRFLLARGVGVLRLRP